VILLDLMDKSEYTIFSLLTNRTSIGDDDISLYWIEYLAEACRAEDHIDLLTIRIVHLTAKCFDIVGFEHK
jgi:hypothetical protein